MSYEDKINNRLKLFRTYLGLQQAEFAEKIGILQQQLSKYETGRIEPSTKFYVKMCEIFKDFNIAWLLTGEGNMLNSETQHNVISDSVSMLNNSDDELTGKSFTIPYWNECPSAEKLHKATVTEAVFDMQIIIRDWGCNPQDLKIISTPGDEMDGGKYPIRNNDILVIDTSKTNISDSGIFLVATHNYKILALRKLIESIDGSVAFSVDNEEYAKYINKTFTREELKAMDFKVIGRVVKNVTYTL